MIGGGAYGEDLIHLNRPIEVINSKFPLKLGKFSIKDEDSVLSIEFSAGGGLLAGISLNGQVKIWQVSAQIDRPNWPLLRILRDSEESQIDEFFTGAFLPNGRFAVAGKRKHRHRWDERSEDAQSLPGQIKIFDLKSGKCIQRLGLSNISDVNKNNKSGHTDEILFIKPITTRLGSNFIISCGQDGRLCRWSFDENWEEMKRVDVIKVGNLAFHFDQMTEEFIAVAVDNGLIIYDILNLKHVRGFKTGFTSYCDFVKMISRQGTKFRFILRGVELLKTETHEPSAPNSILITEIDLTEKGAKIISKLQHNLYYANSWLIKPSTTLNNKYLAAPTITGKILIFNMQTGQITANFYTHDDSEVRHVAFHPKLPLMASCGDDGRIRIYYQTEHTQVII